MVSVRPVLAVLGVLCFLAQTVPPIAQASDPAVLRAIMDPAEKDNPDALFALSILFEAGRDVPKDMDLSARLLQRAAAMGHGPSLTQLGLLYQTGTSVPRDPARAHASFQKAATAGDIEGQYRLGMSYLYGIGTSVQGREAQPWMTRAAAAGHQEAAFALGLMLARGTGGEKNEYASRRWLGEALKGPDAGIRTRVRPIYDELDNRLLYSGMSGEELLTRAAVGLMVVALAIDLFTDGGTSTFSRDPSHPLNPMNYDGFGTTKRRQNCRMVSTRTGMDITSGRGLVNYGMSNVWRCD